MNKQNKRPILEVLDELKMLAPIKICFNDFELYNDYDSIKELEPGVFGELAPYSVTVPLRLKTALDKYDVLVEKINIRFVHHHHSIVYLYGEKVLRETNEEGI
jgi:hypothetical protein